MRRPSTELTPESRLRPAPRVLARRLGREVVALEADAGVYFGLDEVAARIWCCLEGRRTLRETLDTLVAEYDVDRERLWEDLLSFVRSSLRHRLIELVPYG